VKRLAAGLVVLTWGAGARAQVAPAAPEAIPVGDWTLTPVVELRVRGEYRHDLDAQDGGALMERARLGVDAERGPVEVRLVLQDARLWDLGSNVDLVGQQPEFASTGAYEAWADVHTPGTHPSFLRVGRQPVTWGEGRLLGASEWSPTARSLDAVRGRLSVGNGAFEALAASLSDPIPPAGAVLSPAYGELVGARAEWGFDPLFAVEAYGLGRFAQSNPAASLEGTVEGATYTAALRLHGDAHPWTWGAEGAAQLGHVSSLGIDRLAWAAAGHVAYTFEHVLLLPTVRLGGSYASGDDGGSQYRAFDPILPDVHTWLGAMDIFSWSNEVEGNARVAISPWSTSVAAVEYRYARMVDPQGSWRSAYLYTIGQVATNTQADLGHEIDATLRWSPWEPLELAAGYSVLVLGEGAKTLLEAAYHTAPSLAHYAFLQATVDIP
jgi:hypothetical protein